MHGAVNHDPAVFEHSDKFDIFRESIVISESPTPYGGRSVSRGCPTALPGKRLAHRGLIRQMQPRAGDWPEWSIPPGEDL